MSLHENSGAAAPSRKRRFQLASRNAYKRLAVLFLLIAVALVMCHCEMIRMPGTSFRGPLPPLTDSQTALAEELHRDVDMLAGVIGHRNMFHPKGLKQAEAFLTKSLTDAGYEVKRQEYSTRIGSCANLEVEIAGATKPTEIVVIGAHYDSVEGSPAANDNGSGVAAVLALARRFRTAPPPARTLRFVLFVNEEPPFFQTEQMGSLVYAKACRERNENIVAMLTPETIGYYSDEPGSQTYPVAPLGWFYPTTGDFISFVGDFGSRKLVKRCVKVFREMAQFPSEGGAPPGSIPGVGWSDHWSFWQCGYPGVMVTDTAPFRYPHYHGQDDTPDKINYEKTARVVEGLAMVVDDLANGR